MKSKKYITAQSKAEILVSEVLAEYVTERDTGRRLEWSLSLEESATDSLRKDLVDAITKAIYAERVAS